MQNIDKSILRIALPSIVANITVPLLGLVDMAVSGHLGNAVYIGAVAVGSMIFNVIYWVFGFLRMGTSGMTSQALGRRDMGDVATTLVRSIAVAIGVAAFILLLQRPLGTATLALVGPAILTVANRDRNLTACSTFSPRIFFWLLTRVMSVCHKSGRCMVATGHARPISLNMVSGCPQHSTTARSPSMNFIP